MFLLIGFSVTPLLFVTEQVSMNDQIDDYKIPNPDGKRIY
jgi:hypothetical protein